MKTKRFLKTIFVIFLLVSLLSPKTLWATTISTDTIIQDGDVYIDVGVDFDAVVDITGGIISGKLTGGSFSRINVWGGVIGGPIHAAVDSQITIYGSNFLLGGQSVSGVFDLDHLTDIGALTLGGFDAMEWTGHLTGILSNGTPLDVDILITHFYPFDDNTANFTLLPEPATSVLVITGFLLARTRKSRRSPFSIM